MQPVKKWEPPTAPNPNEPTLTCSEVVERLAKCVYMDGHGAGRYATTYAALDRKKAAEILHSWRERRVQELEEALREAAEEIADARYRSGREGYEAAELYRGEPERDKLVDSIVAAWREQIRKGAKHE